MWLTIADNVEGACNSFAGGVVTSTHATFVPPGFRVQYMVTACLLLSKEVRTEGRIKYKVTGRGMGLRVKARRRTGIKGK